MTGREGGDGGPAIDRPVVILGAPRSGTTLLFRCLAVHPDLWHLPAESHEILEGPLRPGRGGGDSNRATASDCDPETARHLRRRFHRSALNLNRVLPDPGPVLATSRPAGRVFTRAVHHILGPVTRVGKPERVRFLEKTPKNTLRVPFLERLFPDARYLFLTRDPLDNIDSLVAGWRAGGGWAGFLRPRFARAGYPVAGELGLEDYGGRYWKFALVPGWRDLAGRSVAEVAAWQYLQCNLHAADDLEAVDPRRVRRVRLEAFVEDPVPEARRLCDWAELPESETVIRFARRLPRVNPAGTDGRDGGDGLRHPEEVRAAAADLPGLAELAARLGHAFPPDGS